MDIIKQVRQEFRIAMIDGKETNFYTCLRHYDKTTATKEKHPLEVESEAEAIEKGKQRFWDCVYIGKGYKYSIDGKILEHSEPLEELYFFQKKES